MNIIMLLEMAATGAAERVAVGRRDTGLTYRQLFDASGSFAASVHAADPESVVLCDESSPAVPISLFGAAWACRPYVPLNYRLPDDELQALAERSGRNLIVTDQAGSARLHTMGTIVDREVLMRHPVAVSSGLSPDDWAADPDQVAVLLFTSGTTGIPKTAVLRHKHLTSYILGSVEFLGADADEATLISVPPYHIAGIAAILSSVYAGRRIVQLPRFDPELWIDTVIDEGITHAMVVPTMLTRIVDALDRRGGSPMAGLRALSYGGGKMPKAVIQRALELFPATDFVNAYGLTETSSTVSLLGPEDHRFAQRSDDPAQQARLSSVGRPLPGIEVSIRDDAGDEVPTGTSGEVYVRGEQVAGEYREEGSRLTADGWFPTRDGGHLDSDGYLFLSGRADDVIIRGGENLSPGEIEDSALELDGLLDAAAIGVPCREWGEKVVLILVGQPDHPTADQVSAHLEAQLRSIRVPAHVEFVDQLPYNETGKLLRRELRDQFAHLGDPDSDS